MTRRQTPGRSTRLGYGAAHQRERRRVAEIVNRGGVRCWRCGLTIHPAEPWDLGHAGHVGRKPTRRLRRTRASALFTSRWGMEEARRRRAQAGAPPAREGAGVLLLTCGVQKLNTVFGAH